MAFSAAIERFAAHCRQVGALRARDPLPVSDSVRAFLQNPQLLVARFEPACTHYVAHTDEGDISLRGLTTTMSRHFYPDWHYTGGGLEGRGAAGGAAAGIAFEARVAAAYGLAAGVPPRMHATIPDPAALGDADTARAVRLFASLNIVPVAYQTVLYDPELRIGSGCDFIGYNVVTHRVVFVELKHGFNGYSDRACGNMRWPFEEFTDAPTNQHQMQVAFALHAACTFYGLPREQAEGYVLRVDNAGGWHRALDARMETVYPVARIFLRCLDDLGV